MRCASVRRASRSSTNTPRGSKPRSIAAACRTLRTNRAAPINSSSETVICSVARAPRSRVGGRPPIAAVESSFSAGPCPASSPEASRRRQDCGGGERRAHGERQDAGVRTNVEAKRQRRQRADVGEDDGWSRARGAAATAPPAPAISTLSATSIRASRPRLAPSATRIASSRRRPSTRASSRLPTLAQAMTSTSPTRPNSSTETSGEPALVAGGQCAGDDIR